MRSPPEIEAVPEVAPRSWRWTLPVAGLAALLPLTDCAGGASIRPDSVILVVVDTLRPDHLGAYGQPRPTSPALDRWSGSGVLFERAFAASPWTLPSFGSLFTGQLPSRHGAGRRVRPGVQGAYFALDESVPTLAALLSAAGYATGAIINNPSLDPIFGLQAGFDLYDYVPGNNIDIRRADVVVDRTLEMVNELEPGPFLIVAHFQDPHLAYDPHEATRGRFTAGYGGSLELPFEDLFGTREHPERLDGEDRDFIVAAYDEEIAFVDRQLDRLLTELDRRGLLDRALVILTSDHGEELFDHGGFEHGHAVFQEVLRVPLIVWGPGVRPGRVDDPVSLVDILPTVLDAVGESVPEEIAGDSVWGTIAAGEEVAARALFAEALAYGPERSTIIRWPHKVILHPSGGRSELYDLARDPGERQDRTALRPDLASALALELRRTLEEATEKRESDREADVDPETREKLRSLGYVQ